MDYDHKVIGKQSISLLLNPEIYKTQICSARTFGFLKDVEELRNSGLALGGSLNNAIVLDEKKLLTQKVLDTQTSLFVINCLILLETSLFLDTEFLDHFFHHIPDTT